MATLVVRRDPTAWMDRLRAYTVMVDGKESGKVRQDSEIRIPVVPGKHSVQIRVDWCSSPLVEIAVARDEEKTVECRPNATPWNALYYAVFNRGDYLSLQARAGRR